MSRSCSVLHSGHAHVRADSAIDDRMCPQQEQRFHTENELFFLTFSSNVRSCILSSQCKPHTSLLFNGTMWSTVNPFSLASLYISAILSLFAHAGMCGDLPRLIALWFLRCCFKCSLSDDTPPFHPGFFDPLLSMFTTSESGACFHVFPVAPDGFPQSFFLLLDCTSGEFATIEFASDKDLAGIPCLFMKFLTATSLHPNMIAISLRDLLSTKYSDSIVEGGMECNSSFLVIKHAYNFDRCFILVDSSFYVKAEFVRALHHAT